MLAALLLPRAAEGVQAVVHQLVFAALSDWGGQSTPPFTTPGQLEAAASLARVAEVLRPSLVVSAGNNFMSEGLLGKAITRAAVGCN